MSSCLRGGSEWWMRWSGMRGWGRGVVVVKEERANEVSAPSSPHLHCFPFTAPYRPTTPAPHTSTASCLPGTKSSTCSSARPSQSTWWHSSAICGLFGWGPDRIIWRRCLRSPRLFWACFPSNYRPHSFGACWTRQSQTAFFLLKILLKIRASGALITQWMIWFEGFSGRTSTDWCHYFGAPSAYP